MMNSEYRPVSDNGIIFFFKKDVFDNLQSGENKI